MIIHRSHPESNFTIIPNDTLRDPRLSYMARGILAEILSRPDDWSTSADATSRRARSERGSKGEGRDTIRRAYAEFEAAGYLHRRNIRRDGGRFGTELHFFDTPVDAEVAKYLLDGVPAGRTDDGTGRRRSDLGKLASSQVAPTYPSPGVGQPGVYTNTEDEVMTTKIDLRSNGRGDEHHPGLLGSAVQVEGNARPSSHHPESSAE